MKKIVRTPDDRFDNLPDYHFKAHYLEVEAGLRMHYVDEGEPNDPIVLLLHGEPSWSYLYRKMIPGLVTNKFRAIAPDLIGFGKSDKFTQQEDYSYQKHIDWLKTFITKTNLKNITLFCQDWGGLTGLRIVTEMPDLFSRIIVSNTGLPTGENKMPEVFTQWQNFAKSSPDFNVGQVVNMGTATDLSKEVIAAYNAPYPSEDYKAGARIFPMLVPSVADDPEAIKNKEAWAFYQQWEKPLLTIFGDSDPITKGGEKYFIKIVPGAKGQAHEIIHAGHFIQEDQGELLAKRIVRFYHS